MRLWKRNQGAIAEVQAGAAIPESQEWVDLGLPWGTKPRLILAHLNAEALRQARRRSRLRDSLSAFVKRIRGFDGGREIRMFKDQLTRLSVATVRLAGTNSERTLQSVHPRCHGFDLWLEKDERQRVLWPSTIKLSTRILRQSASTCGAAL